MFDQSNAEIEVPYKGHVATFEAPRADVHLGYMPLVAALAGGVVRLKSELAELDRAELSEALAGDENGGFETSIGAPQLRRIADYLASRWLAFDGVERNGEIVTGEQVLERFSPADIANLFLGFHRRIGLSAAQKKTSPSPSS